jgi:hypothetical protein
MPYADGYKKEHIPTAVQFEFPIAEMNTMSPDMEKNTWISSGRTRTG